MLPEAGAAQPDGLFANQQRVGEHFFQSSCRICVHGFLCVSDPCSGSGLHQVCPVRSPPNVALLSGVLGARVAGPGYVPGQPAASREVYRARSESQAQVTLPRFCFSPWKPTEEGHLLNSAVSVDGVLEAKGMFNCPTHRLCILFVFPGLPSI